MPSTPEAPGAWAAPPDPGGARTVQELVERLRALKVWAGDPSYERIKSRVNDEWTGAGRPAAELARRTTVADCFAPGRRRLNNDLVVSIVRALNPDPGYVAQWRQALRVVTAEVTRTGQVLVRSSLPDDPAPFVGRLDLLGELRATPSLAGDGDHSPIVFTVSGMAGVGKTMLAVHAAHRLTRDWQPDRVLFVNLRGFHSDPDQPPADPAAVLDGFLRVLGVPGQRVPQEPAARAALYRDLLSRVRALVVLDNAADEEQVRPLLPGTPNSIVMVTSRRHMPALPAAVPVPVAVFTHREAMDHLVQATAGFAAEQDPDALERLARACGRLPLALGIVAALIARRPGWTLADHADRLDEQRQVRLLEAGVELALDLSYRNLPGDDRQLLRMAALHPGQEVDAHAAAALANCDVAAAGAGLERLRRENLLLPVAKGRYAFHDLVQVYAAGRARDEERPAERSAALVRMTDYYLAAAATAMDILHPAEAHRRPRVPAATTPCPPMAGPADALAFLELERTQLMVVTAHSAAEGRAAHAVQLSSTLFRFFAGGHHADALTVHDHALRAARRSGDVAGEATAHINIGVTSLLLGRLGPAGDHLSAALRLAARVDDPVAQARALDNLGAVETRLGRYMSAAELHTAALPLFERTGDLTGQARTLLNLGILEGRNEKYGEADARYTRALDLFRRAGDRNGEAEALNLLGDLEGRVGRFDSARVRLRDALELFRQTRNAAGESQTLDSLGLLHVQLGEPGPAADCFRQALAIFRDLGDEDSEAWSLNGLGEAALLAGNAGEAVGHHTAAERTAAATGSLDQRARARAGRGHAHRELGDLARAEQDYEEALRLYLTLGTPEADEVREFLAAVRAPDGRG
ncbi:tetratricopeptide repeat protein [Paractinoplanes brasiliensis]|uniref:Tetratricopeptide repeat protein n=1 Tax=Paractinoplanes brasiliensis TaxID=52695 RepID=A0A4R6JB12_9ACTN|nr:tetratricopeptide repeat protein [Actinoplanes brasiliensis]TDO32910.1 tetratricopeptide repeat protein [Actinoplanes brasiliensis]GID28626.1 hypothetical protein Abr02nite_36090 [Actinoplanes brasiliensis]